MNSSTWIVFFLIFVFCILIPTRNRKMLITRNIIKNKRKMREKNNMKDFVKQFVGKKVIVTIMSGSQSTVTGVIKEVTDTAILVENNSKFYEAINLDYVVKISEYPANKKGKDKMTIHDFKLSD